MRLLISKSRDHHHHHHQDPWLTVISQFRYNDQEKKRTDHSLLMRLFRWFHGIISQLTYSVHELMNYGTHKVTAVSYRYLLWTWLGVFFSNFARASSGKKAHLSQVSMSVVIVWLVFDQYSIWLNSTQLFLR